MCIHDTARRRNIDGRINLKGKCKIAKRAFSPQYLTILLCNMKIIFILNKELYKITVLN